MFKSSNYYYNIYLISNINISCEARNAFVALAELGKRNGNYTKSTRIKMKNNATNRKKVKKAKKVVSVSIAVPYYTKLLN